MYRIRDFEKKSYRLYLLKKMIVIISYIVIIPMLIFNLILTVKSYINPDKIPDILGFKSFVIVSESMETTIMTGDAIFVKEAKQEEIKVNDIISFHDGDSINTHRIVEIIDDNGTIKYKTKGDNNKKEDKEKVTYDKIEGKFQFKINGVGRIVEAIKNKVTLVILLVLLVLISAYEVRISKKMLIRKEKRYEYNSKKFQESRNNKNNEKK